MSKLRLIVLGAVVVVVALGAAFWLLNFRVMTSSTAYDAQVATSNPTTENGQAVVPSTPTALIVEGNSEFAAALRARLAPGLGSVPGLGPINLVSQAAEARGAAVIYVDVQEQRIAWTPFYARAELVVRVAYSTNGDVAFRLQNPPAFTQVAGHEALQMLGTYNMADVSKGAMSRAGYRDYVAGRMADYVRNSLQQQLVK